MSVRANYWIVAAMVIVIVCVETGLRLGGNSPDTRFTLPAYGLGYFWDTPLGWTGVVDGVAVNKDSVQFVSLAGVFRDEPAVPVPPQDNVYVRFAGYSLVGSVLAPLLGTYASFVVINVIFWVAAALATYALALRVTRDGLIAVLAAILVATAPAFEALAGQALPYVASYGLFVVGLLLFELTGVFGRNTESASTKAEVIEPKRDERAGTVLSGVRRLLRADGQRNQSEAGRADWLRHARPEMVAVAVGFASGVGFLFYDLYMLPAFVVLYGLLRRTPLRTLVLVLVAIALPRIIWSGYWQLSGLPSYSHNETHPIEALMAWFDAARTGAGLARIKGYALLAAHGALNIGAVFLFWPVILAAYELWQRRRSPEAAWFAAVIVAGFAPALFMLSTWPHIPRWYGYGFPAVYILAAAAAVRLARSVSAPRLALGTAVALTLVLPAVILSNLDVVGATKPMELLLFQPTHWSYLWSR